MGIFAPLALRIGMYTVAAELETLALAELHPEAAERVAAQQRAHIASPELAQVPLPRAALRLCLETTCTQLRKAGEDHPRAQVVSTDTRPLFPPEMNQLRNLHHNSD